MKPVLRHVTTVLVALALAACGGKIAQDDEDAAGDGFPSVTPTAPTDVPTTPTSTPTAVPTATGTPKDSVWCGMPTGANLPYASSDALRGLLVGRWIYCEGEGRIGPKEVVGFEIDDKKHWWYLRRASDGSLFRETTAGYQGWCVVLDDGRGNYQVDLDVDTGGAVLVTQTQFTDGPRRVHLHHRDGYAAYLRVTE
ncbi:MAG: hypothetical protein ABI175_16415 [Polyangiales bacterium]